MLARLGDRLSYANVVATIALFVALGGTGYAASQITSGDVKNRSLKGGDLRLNTVTGKEIRESRLGRVPAAENAATADVSKSAGTATTAGSAGTADVANVARDAQSLAGQGAGAFEKSTRAQFGRGSVDPAGTSGEQVLLDWPEMGVQFTTASNQAACAAGELRIGVRNTKGAGAPTAFVLEQDAAGELASVAPGATARPCTNASTNEFQGQIADSSGRSLFVDCRNFQGELRCLGVRSEA